MLGNEMGRKGYREEKEREEEVSDRKEREDEEREEEVSDRKEREEGVGRKGIEQDGSLNGA